MNGFISNLCCPETTTNTSVSEPWTGEREDISESVDSKFISSTKDDAPRISKADILLEISRNPGLYADDLAERLGMPTKLAVELVSELIDEGILESSKCIDDS